MSDKFDNAISEMKSMASQDLTISWNILDPAGRRSIAMRRRGDSGAVREVIHIGDEMTLNVETRRAGYLSLFNFGTGGEITPMFPNPEFGTHDNYIKPGAVHSIPGDLLPAELLGGGWRECGPETSFKGLPERIIAILTDEPVSLSASCFGVEAAETLSRGAFAAVEESISRLSDLDGGTWTFGLLEADVLA